MKLTHIGMYPLMAALALGAWAVTPNLVQSAAAQQRKMTKSGIANGSAESTRISSV